VPIVVVTVNRAPMDSPALLLAIVIAVSVLTHFAKLLPAMMAFKTETKLPSIVVVTVNRAPMV
jgi:hypothetical protein